MIQQTFSDIEYAHRRRRTRRESFLDFMDELIPWAAWIELIRPCYPTGKRGRPPRDIETMLRMYLIQIWFGLSAAGTTEAVNDSHAMRSFMHLDFMTQQVPDASTLLRFRHLLEKNHIDEIIAADLNDRLARAGYTIRNGKIVDAAAVMIRKQEKEIS